MSSRKELKERRCREREEAEQRAQEQSRRRRRMRLYAAVAVAAVALASAAALALLAGDGDPQDVFAAKPAGLDKRLKKARLTLGSDHPGLRLGDGDEVYVSSGTREQSPIAQ